MQKFIESKLDKDFSKGLVLKIKQLIKQSASFTLSGMPGVGGSFFLRYLALQDFAYFVYVDTYQLAEINKLNYYKLLLHELGGVNSTDSEQEIIEKCRERLGELVKTKKRVVIILNRFDQLKQYFNNQLFADLMSLRNIDLEKIVFIFTSNIPYPQILPENITADKINLLATTVHIKPFAISDLKKLIKILRLTSIWHSKEFIEKAIFLSGGHVQLLQLLLKSERLDPPFVDQYVKYQLRELFNYLNYNQKKQVKKIALGKLEFEVDPYLINVGMVVKNGNNFQLFTPLLKDYINSLSQDRMSEKELKLFKLLKNQLGKTVLKEEIFQKVWENNPEEASDWALTSLIYRLRKHPTLKSQNYTIESHKKLGYLLIKS